MVVVVDDEVDDEDDVVDDEVALMLLVVPVDVIWFDNAGCGVIGDDVADDGSGTDVSLKTCLRFV